MRKANEVKSQIPKYSLTIPNVLLPISSQCSTPFSTETNAKLANYLGPIDLAKATRASKYFYQLNLDFFAEMKKKYGHGDALEVLDYSKRLVEQFFSANSKKISNACIQKTIFNIFQKLRQAFYVTEDIELKFKILIYYNQLMDKFDSTIKDKTNKIVIHLNHIKLDIDIMDQRDPIIKISAYSRRIAKIQQCEALLKKAANDEDKQLVAKETLAIIRTFRDHPPRFAEKSDETFYISQMENQFKKWMELLRQPDNCCRIS